MGEAAGAEGEAEQHALAVERLLSLPRAEALAVLRAYSVSATAKDCALMIALRRLEGPDAGATAAPTRQHAGCATAGDDDGALPTGPLPTAAAAGGPARPPMAAWGLASGAEASASALDPGTILDPGSSLAFHYTLCFIDLDLKPLAKIPAHFRLDQQILGAARRRQQLHRGEWQLG